MRDRYLFAWDQQRGNAPRMAHAQHVLCGIMPSWKDVRDGLTACFPLILAPRNTPSLAPSPGHVPRQDYPRQDYPRP